MRRYLSFVLVLLAAATLFAEPQTHLVSSAASVLVLEGSSNVTGWRCRGTTLDGRMEVAAPLAHINEVIDRIEDGNIAGWMSNPTAARFPQPSFNLTIPVSTLRCGNRQMERDMYQALRSQVHPDIAFRFTQLVGGVNHDIDRGTYRAMIAGELTLAGATRTIRVPVEATRLAANRFRLRARLPLRMTDFRITPPTALFGMVKAKNDLVVNFDLVLEKR
jgi:hypothetical protein